MSDTTVAKPPDLDDAETAWDAMKLSPARTGLPMALWITGNEYWPHAKGTRYARWRWSSGSNSRL